MHGFLFSLAACVVIAISASAQPSRALFAGDGRSLEYKAEVEMRADNIDDVFNASADEGWRPHFMIEDHGRYRLLFTRPIDGEYEPMRYKAETLLFADNIADHLDHMAEGGWRPLFIFPAGLRYRMLFEREQNPALHLEREYRADPIDETRMIDDVFNVNAANGWRAMFLLSATDSTEIRMLFGRGRGDEAPQYRYKAQKVRSSRRIDDAFNDLAEERWRPIFTFRDKDEYRILFERPVREDGARFEYRAVRVDESSDIDDAFNRYASDGWDPVDLLWEESRAKYRVLFARPVDNTAGVSGGKRP